MTNAEMVLHLIDARKRLAKGWCRGILHQRDADGGERWCLMGAIWGPLSQVDWDDPLFQTLLRALPPPYASIAHFNDTLGTQLEVLDFVDHVIASLMRAEAVEVARPHEGLVVA